MRPLTSFFKFLTISTAVLLLAACGGGGGGSEDSIDSPDNVLDPGAALINPSYDPTLPVRGVGFFPVMHPKIAQPGPNGIVPLDAIIEILRESSSPGFSFPYQTFGNQTQNYMKLIDSMLAVGKPPVVGIYAICGPCRKGRSSGDWVYFYPEMDIGQFNSAIQNNPAVRESYLNLLRQIRQLIELYPNLKYVLYPELEDNFDDNAFKAALDMNIQVFGDMPNVEIRRNPLEFRNGGRGENTFGLQIERHGTTIESLRLVPSGGSLNFDGSDFNYPDQFEEGDPSFDDVRNLILEARATNKEVYVWDPTWQGRGRNLGGGAVHPDNRIYSVTHINELKELMYLGDVIPETVPESAEEKIVTRFLWKPESEGGGPGYQGKPVILLDPLDVVVKVNGEEFFNTGPSNGWAATYRSNGNTCRQYSGQIRVEFFDKTTGEPLNTLFGQPFETIESPCTRKQWG